MGSGFWRQPNPRGGPPLHKEWCSQDRPALGCLNQQPEAPLRGRAPRRPRSPGTKARNPTRWVFSRANDSGIGALKAGEVPRINSSSFDLFGHISQAVFQDPVAALSLDNQTVFNDYFQPIDFGTTESFNVTLNGPTALGGGPSAFNIAFYAADGATSLLTVSPDGNAGQIVVNPDGTTAVATFASGPNAGSALTITAAVSSSVPEPVDLMLLSISFAVAPLLWRKRLYFRKTQRS